MGSSGQAQPLKFRSPEGVYVCRDWLNPVQARYASQHGLNPSLAHSSFENVTLQSRYALMNEMPRMSGAIIRPRTISHAEATSVTRFAVPSTLVSQGLDAEASDEMPPSEAASTDSFEASAHTSPTSAGRLTRPKLSLRTLGGSFIVRSNQHQDLSRYFGNRTESSTFTVSDQV